jgi:hypothetical protein
VLAAAGYNFRRLLAWLAALWRVFLMALLADATNAALAPLGRPPTSVTRAGVANAAYFTVDLRPHTLRMIEPRH